jgi:hypothetical protein
MECSSSSRLLYRSGEFSGWGRGRKACAAEPAGGAPRSEAQEVSMLKALLTPVVLGLAVAVVIRLMAPRRAY